jgi:hypothetical protein
MAKWVRFGKRSRQTTDRARYEALKRCSIKTTYDTVQEAQCSGQFAYICSECGKYHRTSTPVKAEMEREVLRRLELEQLRQNQSDQ